MYITIPIPNSWHLNLYLHSLLLSHLHILPYLYLYLYIIYISIPVSNSVPITFIISIPVRPWFSPWVGKIPWRRKWRSTPVFLPGKSHRQRSLVGWVHGVAKSRTLLSHFTFFLSRSVQFSHSVLSDSLRPHELQHYRPPCQSPTPGVTQTHVHQLGDAIQQSHPLHPLLLLPPIPPSIRVFSNESTRPMRWPKYWSFSFSISPSNEHPGLISFRMDWLNLLAVQGTLKSLLWHHSSKASIIWCSPSL